MSDTGYDAQWKRMEFRNLFPVKSGNQGKMDKKLVATQRVNHPREK